ncbi:MAG: hypothetical protein HRT72_05055 [Flavobacteriales bacterium]|nr:hypothetical protein [Flavobacteriales bacterium]
MAVALVLILSMASASFGQLIGGEFEKLGSLYLEGKYEDCNAKALKYTESDKTKRHPEPYLYLAMSNYQIADSDDKKLTETYPNALKDAMKWAAKFKKKDKEDDYYTKSSKFLNKLKTKALKIADEFYAAKNYKKAAFYFKSIYNFSADPNVKFIWGMCDLNLRSTGQATLSISSAAKELNRMFAKGEYNSENSTAYELSLSLIEYSDHLMTTNKKDSAQKTIVMARKLLPGDEDVQAQFGKLME